MECTSFSSRTQTEPFSPENEEILVPIDNVPGFRESPKGQVTSRDTLPHESEDERKSVGDGKGREISRPDLPSEPRISKHSCPGDEKEKPAGSSALLGCKLKIREPLKGQVSCKVTLPPESKNERDSARDRTELKCITVSTRSSNKSVFDLLKLC